MLFEELCCFKSPTATTPAVVAPPPPSTSRADVASVVDPKAPSAAASAPVADSSIAYYSYTMPSYSLASSASMASSFASVLAVPTSSSNSTGGGTSLPVIGGVAAGVIGFAALVIGVMVSRKVRQRRRDRDFSMAQITDLAPANTENVLAPNPIFNPDATKEDVSYVPTSSPRRPNPSPYMPPAPYNGGGYGGYGPMVHNGYQQSNSNGYYY